MLYKGFNLPLKDHTESIDSDVLKSLRRKYDEKEVNIYCFFIKISQLYAVLKPLAYYVLRFQKVGHKQNSVLLSLLNLYDYYNRNDAVIPEAGKIKQEIRDR